MVTVSSRAMRRWLWIGEHEITRVGRLKQGDPPGHGTSEGNRGREYWSLVCPQVSYTFIRWGGSARMSVCSQLGKTQRFWGKHYSETSSTQQSFLSSQSLGRLGPCLLQPTTHRESIPRVPSQGAPKSTPFSPMPCPWLGPDATLPGFNWLVPLLWHSKCLIGNNYNS